MSKRISGLLIIDMVDAISDVLEYMHDLTFEQFLLDKKTKDAVVRNLLKLGEAAYRLPKDFRDGNHQIEWNRIIRTRHILTHEYERVDYEVIWRIGTIYLPPLLIILKEIKDQSPS